MQRASRTFHCVGRLEYTRNMGVDAPGIDFSSLSNATYVWLADRLLGGESTLDHLLIAMLLALALASCGGASYAFWGVGLRIIAVVALLGFKMLCASQALVIAARHYPDASAHFVTFAQVN